MAYIHKTHSGSFLKAVEGKSIVVVMHDNPDPDAIAAGWALVELLRQRLGQTARLVARGAIVRAENLQMVRLLKPPLELVDDLRFDDCFVVLVDCSPAASNHPANSDTNRILAVIDHHEPTANGFRPAYSDIRPRVAATAGIAAKYLREQEVEPGVDLATALLYAIHTELAGPDAHLTRFDRGMIAWLSERADHGKLAEIEGAPLPRVYFSDLTTALENADTYEDVALCFLPRASGPEIVGEIADLLIRCEGIHRVLCGAAVGSNLILSARTTRNGGDVLPLLRATLQGFGSWGGHKHRAGGKVTSVSGDGRGGELLFATLKSCWLAACELDHRPGIPLVRGREALLSRNAESFMLPFSGGHGHDRT
jgi:nanoRNase/pAp phosphatase (c-di-AMP/oligoRNAs hydrolase)